MRATGLFTLIMVVCVAASYLGRSTDDAHRHYLRMATMPAAVADHWYMGTDGRLHPRPGRELPFVYDDPDFADDVRPPAPAAAGTTVPTTVPAPPPVPG